MFAAALFAAGFLGASAYTPEALADQVTSLPGAENLDISFNQFSGYLTVGETKQMHYWYVESMKDPVNDPVAFWTNGGPGCSGLLGFLTEQGPFRPNKDMSLSLNEFAWNQISNMVFIEAPCGVGYSYSSTNSDDDYKADDASTAADNYAMIQAFFNRFPDLRSNKMYISSESYGGHYMPTLAQQIVDQNTAGTNPHLNFKGFAVGNPFTEVYSGFPAMLETYWGHQMVAKPVWDTYQSECVDARIPNITICEAILMDIYIGVGNINPYAIDYPVCTEESARVKSSGRNQRYALLDNILSSAGHSKELRATMLGLDSGDEYQPCEDNYAETYMNLPEVQKALHVNPSISWAECSRTIRYSQLDGKNSMVPIYQYLLSGGFDLDILVFSGDDDAVCGTVGVQHWIYDIGYAVKGRSFKSYEVNQQMAGYATKFDGAKLGFVTVHGAGHEVPTYKPEVALHLWQTYLEGGWTN
jgi:carboxypeptidase C (cathepsin A)